MNTWVGAAVLRRGLACWGRPQLSGARAGRLAGRRPACRSPHSLAPRPPTSPPPAAVNLIAMATPEDMRADAEHIRMADQFVEVGGAGGV